MENRNIALYVLVGLIVLGIGYGVWSGFLNKGTIAITTTAPFSAQIDTDPVFTCSSSPCEFRVKTGSHSVAVKKDGYSDYAKLVDVSMGSKTELNVELEKIVKAQVMSEKFVMPKIENPFVLQVDKNAGLQAIVKKSGDPKVDDEIIAYFSRPFESPKIQTNTNQSIAWISDKGRASSSIYKVDVQKKSRMLVYETKDTIRGIVPSESGKVLAVILGNRVDLVKIGEKNTTTITLNSTLDSEKFFAWKSDNVFFYVDHNGESGTNLAAFLKRSYMNNIKQEDAIRAWIPLEDSIEQIVNDAKGTNGGRLVVIGKKANYAVEY